MGRNASIDQVFEEFESTRRARNRTIGIKGGGVTIALDDRDDAGLPSGRNLGEAQDGAVGVGREAKETEVAGWEKGQ